MKQKLEKVDIKISLQSVKPIYASVKLDSFC